MQASELNSLLNSFSPISLGEMDRVKLMNRFDTKYVFSAARLSSLLELLSGNYKILEINNKRAFPYSTLYLDTSNYLFYNQHVTGKLLRHKVRYRRYESTGATFLEIKRKTNKNRTIKWRISNNSDDHPIDNEASAFIKKHITSDDLNLLPVMKNRFTRTTLIGIKSNERITFDYNMDYSTMAGKTISLPFVVIAELKSENISKHSPFIKAIRQTGIHPVGFSKYCIGNAMLLDVPKKNLLKPRLLLLNKIENEYSKSIVS